MVRNGILAVLLAMPFVFAAEGVGGDTTARAGGVYIVAFRTPAHVRSSSPDVFHSAAADVRKMLEDGNVSIVRDAERGFIENESQMSVESMIKLAREAGAGCGRTSAGGGGSNRCQHHQRRCDRAQHPGAALDGRPAQ